MRIQLVGLAMAAALVATPALSAPIMYVDDTSNRLGTVDVANGLTTVIGTMTGDVKTDIAFSPSGQLYGISFGNFYSIDKTTAATTLVGPLGNAGGGVAPNYNALVFGSNGTLYSAAFSTPNLYTINVGTGVATSLGAIGNGTFRSAGDLAFAGGNFYLSAFNGSGTDVLVRLDLSNLANSVQVGTGFSATNDVFGLATGENGTLYAVAGTQVYPVDLTTGAVIGAGQTFNGSALAFANGETFFLEAVSVPEPATLSFFGLGLLGLGAMRRRRKA